MEVLCIECYAPMSKKSIKPHRESKHKKVGGELKDQWIPQTVEITAQEEMVKVRSLADPKDGYYSDMGIQIQMQSVKNAKFALTHNLTHITNYTLIKI